MKFIIKKIYSYLPLKKQAFNVIKLFMKLDPKIYRHFHFKGIIQVDVNERDSFKMIHFGHYIENEIFWSGLYGGWEKESLKVWSKLVLKSEVILDIGANTGIYSLIAKSLSPNSDVYAFEPVKRIFEKLEKNSEINKYNVKCSNIALSDEDGIASIYDPMTEHLYSVTINRNLNSDDIKVKEVEVQTKKISTIIEETNIKNIDLMKIDVETHEVEVLKGMGKYLVIMQPTILIEILNNDIAKGVMEIIKDIDYMYYYIDESGGLQRKEVLSSEVGNNYLICKKEIANQLGLG